VYDGHHQPLLPRDLGFYDLRLDEVRSAQHALAEASGISGLMYYYYWFAGKRLLDAPVEALVRSDIPQPFCVMWANENWTRRWDGGDSDVLIAQDEGVSPEAFIEDILPLLADERYMTIHGRKIVAVYKPGQIAGFTDVVASWRSRARAAGAGELFVVAVDFGGERGLDDTRRHGVDASLGFPPHNHLWEKIPEGVAEVDRRFKGAVLSYAALVEDACRRLQSGESTPSFPGVMVAFDNTPRRQWSPHIWFGSNPYTFRRWLAAAVESVSERPPDERLVFVNAWNEWAEGAVLEPTERFGQTFLLAVREVVRG
jgi:lipopolysaccharide biosynthesis protein